MTRKIKNKSKIFQDARLPKLTVCINKAINVKTLAMVHDRKWKYLTFPLINNLMDPIVWNEMYHE